MRNGQQVRRRNRECVKKIEEMFKGYKGNEELFV